MGLFNKLKALRDDAQPAVPAEKTPPADLEWLPPQAPAPSLSSPMPPVAAAPVPGTFPSAVQVPPAVPSPAANVPAPATAPLATGAVPASAKEAPAVPTAPTAAPVPGLAPGPEPGKPGGLPPALLKDLADKVGKLAKSTQAEQESVKGFTDKVSKMEERVEKFQMLFEALSLKYNPFLGKEEAEVFDGIQPDRPAKPSAANVAVRLREGNEIVHTDAVAPPTNGHATPPNGIPAQGPTNGNGQFHPAPEAPAPSAYIPHHTGGPVHPHEPNVARVTVPPTLGSRGASGGPRQAPWGGAAVQGTRESYLVLSWFEHMLETVDPPQIYRFLDYYLELGWITREVHDWFVHLAVSVAPISEEERAGAAAGRKPSPLELVRLHKASLQFFDYLFRINLNPGEGRHLERVVDGLVQREGRIMRKIARRATKAPSSGPTSAPAGAGAAPARGTLTGRKGERGRGV